MQEEKKTVYLKRNANQQTKLLKSNKWNIRAFFHLWPYVLKWTDFAPLTG